MPPPTEMHDVLRQEVRNGVAVLTLNRPDALNAYTPEIGRRLGEAYRCCDGDDSVRVIVVTGSGSAFCAGADMSDADPFDSPTHSDFSASPVQPAAFELRKPVIAAMNGHAIGIGFTLALQTDIRVVAEEAKYGVVQSRRGVIGDCMSHWTLQRLAGLATAADLLLTGRTVRGTEVARMGIAVAAVPGTEVLKHAMTIAADIVENVAPMSAALSKRLLWDTATNGYAPRQVAGLETHLHRRLMGRDDSSEAVAAYRAKRSPMWTASVPADWQDLPDQRADAPMKRHFAELLGFRYGPSDEQQAVVQAMPTAEHCNERGTVHGGFLAALLDAATGLAVHSALDEQLTAPHFDLTIQYLRPAVPGTLLTCVARTTKAGRRVVASEAEVFQDGKMVARAIGSHAVV
ncbi:putative enoyl-CoA hydratase echA8 [Mycobacterium persicum]|uniref:Enoyl-CoA hydratase echA8 n=3 Tax=Mycobacteriaceae TaxID=1762 RepID=A0ABY6RF23_9MYCO|nr:putative enoyl-CoA hydratase echA8 [Mycobacterium persicum]VAZ90327.1 putative enoyl-CoA hydratase echA8 [Mycobacterium persicum]